MHKHSILQKDRTLNCLVWPGVVNTLQIRMGRSIFIKTSCSASVQLTRNFRWNHDGNMMPWRSVYRNHLLDGHGNMMPWLLDGQRDPTRSNASLEPSDELARRSAHSWMHLDNHQRLQGPGQPANVKRSKARAQNLIHEDP